MKYNACLCLHCMSNRIPDIILPLCLVNKVEYIYIIVYNFNKESKILIIFGTQLAIYSSSHLTQGTSALPAVLANTGQTTYYIFIHGSSRLRVTWWRPTAADWGCGMPAACTADNWLLAAATDGRLVRCGIISSCQSAATSEFVKRLWSRVWLV